MADFHSGQGLFGLIQEFIPNIFLDEPSGGGAADLARVEGNGFGKSLGGGLDIDIVEDHTGALAPEFQLDRNEIAPAGFGYHAAYFGGAGKRHALDVGMPGKGCPGRFTETCHHIDNPFGEPVR